MKDILERILSRKREEVESVRAQAEEENWEQRARQHPSRWSFEEALRQGGRIRVIAEIKKASPSAGILREDYQPVTIARSYQDYGADALSVLTDRDFFQGSLDDLKSVAEMVRLPVLRKDFVVDPLQIYEARIAGASAVLLIAEALTSEQLRDFVSLILELGMCPLVELHEEENLPAVLDSGSPVIGINNRNLRTFETSIDHTLGLLPKIDEDRLVVSESGIKTREDVVRLEQAGVGAILVGEAFMRAPEPGPKLNELLGY